jgi:hypothetical protein
LREYRSTGLSCILGVIQEHELDWILGLFFWLATSHSIWLVWYFGSFKLSVSLSCHAGETNHGPIYSVSANFSNTATESANKA